MREHKSAGDLLRKYAIVLVLLLLCILFTILNPAFVSINNLMQILRNISISGIAAIGMMLCILTGGFDLSVGTIQGVAVVTMAVSIIKLGLPVWVAVILSILFGVIIGLLNGLMITKLSVPPFIATLATQEIFRGIIYVVTGAKPIFGYDSTFTTIGQGKLFGYIPIPIFFFVVIFALAVLFLNRTTFGRYIYGVGGNAEAARLAGVNVSRVKTIVYGISGLLAAIAGVILASRLNSGQPRAGIGLEFEVITAVVLGGVSLSGGEGKLSGVLVGILISGVLSNGLILTGVTEYYQMIITGLVLAAAVGFDASSQVRRNKMSERQMKELQKQVKLQ